MPAVAAPAAPANGSESLVEMDNAADNSFSSVLKVTLNGRTAAATKKRELDDRKKASGEIAELVFVLREKRGMLFFVHNSKIMII